MTYSNEPITSLLNARDVQFGSLDGKNHGEYNVVGLMWISQIFAPCRTRFSLELGFLTELFHNGAWSFMPHTDSAKSMWFSTM